ncbi:hypothetical protein G6F35_014010 [Rhizopus arrhizus]|nr:hypothetical protein G6F35_014010 [Rhizopus arrhizus]KAG1251772.1 hypothetical protein G6F65_018204 [Rhizopus arrhizus]
MPVGFTTHALPHGSASGSTWLAGAGPGCHPSSFAQPRRAPRWRAGLALGAAQHQPSARPVRRPRGCRAVPEHAGLFLAPLAGTPARLARVGPLLHPPRRAHHPVRIYRAARVARRRVALWRT